jgi:hypothetical protein
MANRTLKKPKKARKKTAKTAQLWGFTVKPKTAKAVKKFCTPENVLSLLGTVVVPLVVGLLSYYQPPIYIEE